MTTMTDVRRNGEQPLTSADPVTVITGETIHVAEVSDLPLPDGHITTDKGPVLPLSLARRRLWWRRDRLVIISERPRQSGSR